MLLPTWEVWNGIFPDISEVCIDSLLGMHLIQCYLKFAVILYKPYILESWILPIFQKFSRLVNSTVKGHYRPQFGPQLWNSTWGTWELCHLLTFQVLYHNQTRLDAFMDVQSATQVHTPCSLGMTPLHSAAESGHLEVGVGDARDFQFQAKCVSSCMQCMIRYLFFWGNQLVKQGDMIWIGYYNSALTFQPWHCWWCCWWWWWCWCCCCCWCWCCCCCCCWWWWWWWWWLKIYRWKEHCHIVHTRRHPKLQFEQPLAFPLGGAMLAASLCRSYPSISGDLGILAKLLRILHQCHILLSMQPTVPPTSKSPFHR